MTVVASLMIQNLARELFSAANEHGRRLPNRAVFVCGELGAIEAHNAGIRVRVPL